jgi:hypothetical protein
VLVDVRVLDHFIVAGVEALLRGESAVVRQAITPPTGITEATDSVSFNDSGLDWRALDRTMLGLHG